MKKIGRNSQCPCGSGRKYKHCCWKKGIAFKEQAGQNREQERFSINKYFSNYHTLDLLSTLAALSLDPRNHGKNLRLDYLVLEALASNKGEDTFVKSPELKEILDTYYPSYVMEDPPENMFTENVISSFGNNTVYGGNFEQGVFTLNKLVRVTNYFRDSLTEDFKKLVAPLYQLLLFISDMIAHRVGHTRNMAGNYESRSSINFPENIEEFKNALWFDWSWLNKYCKDFKIDISLIEHFQISRDDVLKTTIDINSISSNPLLKKPLLRLSDGIIVVSPTNIVSALVHFTWSQAIQYGCINDVVDMFHKLVLDELIFYLTSIGFQRVPYEFPEEHGLPVKHAIFKFDEDKYALLMFNFDTGESYDLSTPCHLDPMQKRAEVIEYNNKLVTEIKRQYPSWRILQMDIYSSIGREYSLSGGFKQEEYGFMASAFQLLSLLKSENLDVMSLWYFERAREIYTRSVTIAPFVTFLDLYSFYRSSHSFYISDKAKPNYLAIAPGDGFEIIKKGVLREDPLVAYYKSDDFGHPVLVPVIKADEYIPRYACREKEMDHLEFFLPDFPLDIWIRSGKKRSELKPELLPTYWEFNETICYWLVQVKEELSDHLKPLGLGVLNITYDFDDTSFFEDLSLLGKKDPDVEKYFKLDITPTDIYIQIPKKIDTYISAPDNEGERILLTKLLVAFGEVLVRHNLPNTLTSDAISSIVETNAPSGLKKMLLLMHTGRDIAIDSRFLVKERYIQEPCRQIFMDLIVPGLGSKCPPVGSIEGKENKKALTKSIVLKVLLPKLKEVLTEYNSYEVLKSLMALNDSHLHQNALKKVRTPTRAHCFADREDVVKELANQAKIADETTLAIRCLIEHVSAEPSFGNKVVTAQVIDDLIALMSLIIYWGSTGDQINYDLFDIRLSVLPSERIGTSSHEIAEEFFSPFSIKMTKEYIEETMQDFPAKFTETATNKKTVPEGLDKSFEDQFGISIAKLGGIMRFFTLFGLQHEVPVASFPLRGLNQKIQDSFTDHISDQEVDAVLSLLALKNRGQVESVPEGFEPNDISPWRYNRRLSYLQRPLVIVDYGPDKENPKVYWTPRHVDLSWRFLNHLLITAKYKAPSKSKLAKTLGKMVQERGAELQDQAFSWFQDNSKGIVEAEVSIGPKGRLKHTKNLGDIDILVVDPSLKTLLSIECKRTERAKNSKEMIEELDKYLHPQDGYFKKHYRRHEWLEKNREKVSKEFGVDVSGFTLRSFFLTNEALAIQFLKKTELPMPVVSMFDLRNSTLSTIVEMIF